MSEITTKVHQLWIASPYLSKFNRFVRSALMPGFVVDRSLTGLCLPCVAASGHAHREDAPSILQLTEAQG